MILLVISCSPKYVCLDGCTVPSQEMCSSRNETTENNIEPVLSMQPTGFVNDYAKILSAQEKQEIETLLKQIEKSTTAEIAVVTTPSLEGLSLEKYAVELFENWGIGKKDGDNGLLILIAPTERKYRIEVGYGLEEVITDSIAGNIAKKFY